MKKKFQATCVIIFCILICLNLKHLALTAPTVPNPYATGPYHVFKVNISRVVNDDYSRMIISGFNQALLDYGEQSNIAFVTDESNSYNMRASSDLIFTVGQTATDSCMEVATQAGIPLVTSGILDYSPYITPQGTYPFCGISSCPNFEVMLSAIIMSNPRLDRVALIEVPQDKTGSYLNNMLKTLLTEAKIPFSQYRLNPDNENYIDEITRICGECSCIYIPSFGKLSEKALEITNIAVAANCMTVTSDAITGKDTVVAVHSDPFDQGYRAGKMAYEILVGGVKPELLSIQLSGTENTVMLYNPLFTEEMGLEIHPSFRAVDSFSFSSVSGLNTKRPSASLSPQ